MQAFDALEHELSVFISKNKVVKKIKNSIFRGIKSKLSACNIFPIFMAFSSISIAIV
jgi:hypothetical protein